MLCFCHINRLISANKTYTQKPAREVKLKANLEHNTAAWRSNQFHNQIPSKLNASNEQSITRPSKLEN